MHARAACRHVIVGMGWNGCLLGAVRLPAPATTTPCCRTGTFAQPVYYI